MCERKDIVILSLFLFCGNITDPAAICNGSMCERKTLSHSIIYGSTADLSAVCYGSKNER
ncbi:MAG: hypothetical protein ACTHKA_22665 [Anaerocolumna jejuensis]